jgi:aspartate/methionine/tyrosine aminotransferase
VSLGRTPRQTGLLRSTVGFCQGRVGADSIYGVLHRECSALFPDEMFADLFTGVGRRPVPPTIVAVVMVLQRLEGLSDREAVDRFAFDARWKYAAGGLDFDYPGFVHTVLVDMQARLVRPARPDRIFQAVLDVAKQAGLVGRRRVLDSTPLYDAVATMDTVTLVRSAIRGLLKAADPGLERELRAVLGREDDYATAGKPVCDYDDPAAREALVHALTADGLALLAVLEGLEPSPEPTYRGALEAFWHAGAQLTSVPVRDDGLDIDHLRRLVEHRRPRLLYCQPGVHNPTGVALSGSRHRQLANLVARFEVPVVEDTSFADLALDKGGDLPPLPGAMLVGTASKLFWGGLRVAWVRAAPELVERLTSLRRAADLATPVADQMVTADLLPRTDQARATRAADLSARLTQTENLLRRRRPSWSWQRPAGGTGLWIDTGTYAVTLVEHARRKGVRLVAGPAFSAFNGFSHHVRLPFWQAPSTLAEALDRIEDRGRLITGVRASRLRSGRRVTRRAG